MVIPLFEPLHKILRATHITGGNREILLKKVIVYL